MRQRRVVGAAVVAALVLVAAGCGRGRASAGTTTSTSAPVPTTAPVTTTTTVAVPAGTALQVTGAGGIAATVTFTHLFDPAAPAYSFETVGSGLRFVAVQFTVVNQGTAAINQSAQAAASIVDDSGHTDTPVIDEVVGCPGFTGGVIALTPGASATGCVAFELPAGTKVRQVRFAFGGSLATTVAEWQVS